MTIHDARPDTAGSRPLAVRRVAIIGNPNTGKTSLFNQLTGLSQRVGNYPGITVEKKLGRVEPGLEAIDLPGTYSLAAQSPDEMVAVRVLLGHERGETRPDAVVVIVDASNLKRNLYLVTQVLEVGLPVVVALNMVDHAAHRGIVVDHAALSRRLGVPVLPIVASRGRGIGKLREAIRDAITTPTIPEPAWQWPDAIRLEVEEIGRGLNGAGGRFLIGRAIVDEGGEAERTLGEITNGVGGEALRRARVRIRETAGPPVTLEARMRYRWIETVVAESVSIEPGRVSLSDRIDAIVTDRFTGAAVFLALMALMFMCIFQWATPLMDLISGGFDALGGVVSGLFAGTPLAGGLLESLLVDGVVAGVGAVVIFLPQIAILFFFLAILEDCGYMARTAYLMDRLFRFCGLSGHSFVPLLSSFACAVPGVMAARTIANPRDRIATILVSPLMSCSARIPVYTIMIAAFVPTAQVLGFLPLQGLVFGLMYVIGVLVAVVVATLLKKTVLRGPTPPFVLELPPYKVPSMRSVLTRVYERSRAFLQTAGTIIFAMSVIVWALCTFPRSGEVIERHQEARAQATATLSGAELDVRLAAVERIEARDLLGESALGRLGRWIEPAVKPLGWDWRIGVSVLASFPAREVVVSTLGIVYGLGEDPTGGDDGQSELIARLSGAHWPDGRRVFDLPVALSIMVFFALCCQCGSTLATIRREVNSWRWPAFAFGYMTALAYVAALVVYQVGMAIIG